MGSQEFTRNVRTEKTTLDTLQQGSSLTEYELANKADISTGVSRSFKTDISTLMIYNHGSSSVDIFVDYSDTASTVNISEDKASSTDPLTLSADQGEIIKVDYTPPKITVSASNTNSVSVFAIIA